jgi:AraC family transcriptional regulator of adaptative response/methylated-DNA-[protein]-cysteine methyltransferase
MEVIMHNKALHDGRACGPLLQGDGAAGLVERCNAYATIAIAIDWLRVNAARQPSLAELAAYVGMSEFHFQRLFARWAGLSPKRYLQFLTKERALAALHAGGDVLHASLDAGLSGPGRLHDLLVSCEAASPGEVKSGGAGLSFDWGLVATPLGKALLATGERGIVKLAFVDGDAATHIDALQRDWPAARLARNDARCQAMAEQLFALYHRPEPIHLFVKGTQFQIKVWEALLKLRPGELTTYGELAQSIGMQGAARAVGGAVGANPIGLLIPCHRVIRSDGALGGYRWGESRKQALLSVELA